MAATSLKLPEALKRRIERLAGAANKTPHAFMVDVLSQEADRAELRERFAADAAVSEKETMESGKAVPLGAALDFLAEHNSKLARERIISGRRAFELLADHPLLGREAEDGRRELILSRGKFGYVAKYRRLPNEDIVLILAVRHQLEADYKGD